MATPATDLGRRWRNTPVVREMDNRRVLWIWRILAGLLVAGLPVIAYLLQHMEYVRMKQRASEYRFSLSKNRRLRWVVAVAVASTALFAATSSSRLVRGPLRCLLYATGVTT